MGVRQCWVAAVTVLVAATAVLAAVPGPNNIRYPDNMVKPKVKCVKEGVFPHPRNCSWYYRCVDRMNIGYYWTYYFECEPGTVFSDDLDQCIHPFLAKPPCGGKTTPRPTPPPTTTTPPSIPCQGVPGTCNYYDICYPEKVTKYLCGKIRCPLRTPELSCAEGYAFDMDERQCAKIPDAASLCGSTTKLSITEAGELACSVENLRPMSEFVERLYCTDYALCDGSTFVGQTQLCTNFYECKRVGNSWTAELRTCPAGLLYSYASDKCVTKPKDNELC